MSPLRIALYKGPDPMSRTRLYGPIKRSPFPGSSVKKGIQRQKDRHFTQCLRDPLSLLVHGSYTTGSRTERTSGQDIPQSRVLPVFSTGENRINTKYSHPIPSVSRGDHTKRGESGVLTRHGVVVLRPPPLVSTSVRGSLSSTDSSWKAGRRDPSLKAQRLQSLRRLLVHPPGLRQPQPPVCPRPRPRPVVPRDQLPHETSHPVTVLGVRGRRGRTTT